MPSRVHLINNSICLSATSQRLEGGTPRIWAFLPQPSSIQFKGCCSSWQSVLQIAHFTVEWTKCFRRICLLSDSVYKTFSENKTSPYASRRRASTVKVLKGLTHQGVRCARITHKTAQCCIQCCYYALMNGIIDKRVSRARPAGIRFIKNFPFIRSVIIFRQIINYEAVNVLFFRYSSVVMGCCHVACCFVLFHSFCCAHCFHSSLHLFSFEGKKCMPKTRAN